ncbi:hypothetical protein BGZ68_002554 [Mortierella alpina]|nr:hypothetical protein BGZ68_002554 [Mortierella alpina]
MAIFSNASKSVPNKKSASVDGVASNSSPRSSMSLEWISSSLKIRSSGKPSSAADSGFSYKTSAMALAISRS